MRAVFAVNPADQVHPRTLGQGVKTKLSRMSLVEEMDEWPYPSSVGAGHSSAAITFAALRQLESSHLSVLPCATVSMQ